MVNGIKGYFATLIDPGSAATAVRVALVVGSVLFLINHGAALLEGGMTPGRWVSACLTYLVPYAVNIHGQYVSRSRFGSRRSDP
ncbi:MAG TPA: nitrate/nitrite transporter NrtS [Myxococcaceae bacterium]|nr:nitrate/nitrite transporter NrtS [Myxococcaceae bacterium]